MHLSHKSVFILIGVISVLVLVSGTSAPEPLARPMSPNVSVIHSSLINISPPDPQVGDLVTFEVSDPTASGQFITDIEWHFPDGSSVSGADRTRVQYRFDRTGVYTVSLRIEALSPYQVIKASTNVNVRPADSSFSRGGEVSTRVMIKSYDADDDNRLDNAEFTSVIDAWISGRMRNEAFLEALDIWVQGETIVRVNGSSSTPVRLIHHGNRRVTIQATSQGVGSIRLTLYDQAGRELLERESTGNRLTVNLQVVQRRALPNGVYLAKVQVQGADGTSRQAMTKKLAVTR